VISRLLTVVLVIVWCFGAALPAAAQGLSGATVSDESKGAAADRGAMKRRMQENCKQNPQQCEE
jgi:TolA-binding protein